jgi:hypothetical protein
MSHLFSLTAYEVNASLLLLRVWGFFQSCDSLLVWACTLFVLLVVNVLVEGALNLESCAGGALIDLKTRK